MKIEILPEAIELIKESIGFYESQSTGLGQTFLESVIEEIDSLKRIAGIHPIVYGKHRKRMRQFPYGIYYSIKKNTVLISAVIGFRRDPEAIRRILQ